MGKLGMLPTEEATIQDVALNGLDRYENSILVNVPKELAKKGVLPVTLFMYFMDEEAICEWTGKKTFLNVEESYIMSSIYPKEHMEKVYRTWIETVEVRRKDGSITEEYVRQYEILDKKENLRIRSEANRYWAENGLESYFEQVAVAKMGGIDPEKLLRYAIIKDSLRDNDDKMANRKIAVDLLGMKVKTKTSPVNIRQRGGNAIIETTSKRKGAGFLASDIDDENNEFEDDDE